MVLCLHSYPFSNNHIHIFVTDSKDQVPGYHFSGSHLVTESHSTVFGPRSRLCATSKWSIFSFMLQRTPVTRCGIPDNALPDLYPKIGTWISSVRAGRRSRPKKVGARIPHARRFQCFSGRLKTFSKNEPPFAYGYPLKIIWSSCAASTREKSTSKSR